LACNSTGYGNKNIRIMIKYISIGLSVIIFFIFSFTLLHDSLSVPSYDDYDATLSFIKKFYFEPHTFFEKIEMLFSRHNEHRIFLSRLVAVTYYYFFNQLNFAHLVIFQNIFLIGSLALLVMIMIQNKFPAAAAILIGSVFLLNLSFWQVSFYYWGGIQYYTVFFFSILSLYFLNKSEQLAGGPFLLAVLFVLMAVFSFGNGFLALFLGGYILWAQKKHGLLLIWAMLTIVLLMVLFVSMSDIEKPDRGTFQVAWMARLLLTFNGSFLFINPAGEFWRYVNITICAVVGVGVLVYWAYLFFNGYARRNPLLYSLFSLPILTGIIISISRFDTKSAGGIAPRYMFFTSIIPVMLILVLWDRKVIREHIVNLISISGVFLWSCSFYNNWHEFRESNEEIVERIEKWEKNPAVRLIYFKDAAHYSETMKWAVDHKVVTGVESPRKQ